MKRIHLLSLLLLLALTSCGASHSDSTQTSSHLETSQGVIDSNDDSHPTTEEHQTTGHNNEPDPTPVPEVKTKTATIKFEGAEHCDQLGLEGNNAKFLNLCNTIVPIFDSVEATNAFLDKQTTFTTLKIGSGSAGGQIIFHLNTELTALKITVQAYNKYIDYSSSWSIDQNATLTVNKEESIDLSVTDLTKEPERKDVEYTFKEGISDLTFKTKNEGKSRVYIHQMTLTYVVND